MPEHQVESAPPAAAVIPAAVRESGADVAADEELLETTARLGGLFAQRKLQLGSVDDPLEDEADRVADHVMRMPAGPVATRMCENCEDESETVSRKPSHAVMRKCTECEQEGRSLGRPGVSFLQRQSIGDSGSLSDDSTPPPIVHEVLRSPGEPLDVATRAFFEPRFGRDFSGVRVHTDAHAGRAARSIDAEAYTVGNHIAFAAHRFDVASLNGRGLLAHELAHVVQQGGTSGATKADIASRSGDPDPVIARRPEPSARRGFSIQVVVNEPVNGHEFCVRAVMQGHRIERDEAERLLDSGALRCYGWPSTYGVGEEWVGHPIRFWVGDSFVADDTSTAKPADIELDPGEKAEMEEEANQRFWARIGEIRMLSKDDPRDAAYREVWKSELEAVLRERHSGAGGAASQVDYDPFSSQLRLFAALGGLPAAGETQELPPDQMAWMLQVQQMLESLTERDWVRLRRVGVPKDDWPGLAEWLARFIAQQRADERAIAKVSALDKFRDLDSAYEAVHGAGRGSMDPIEGEAYGHTEELDRAAGDFRAAFRTRALEIADEMLRHSATAMQVERSRMQSRQERVALFAALANPTIPQALLDDHPILRETNTLKNAHNPRTPEDLGDWLGGEAYQQAERIKYLSDHLDEKPDVVFGFDVVVAATLAELGLEKSIHAEIIQMGWGRSDGSSLFDTLLEIGLTVLMFVPVIGPVVGAVQGFRGFDAAMADYAANKDAFALGLRTTEPSKSGVVLGGLGLVAGALPIAHELGTMAPSLGQMERLAVTEAGTVPHAPLGEPVPSVGNPLEPPVSPLHPPGGEPPVPTEMRGVQMADEAHSIQIRPAEVPVPATAAEVTALRNTEVSALGRRTDLARDLERLRLERSGVDGAGGLRGQIAKRDKLLEAGTLNEAGKDSVRAQIKDLETKLDANDVEIAKLQPELSTVDEELAHVRARLRNEGAVPAGQPRQLAAGKLREAEVGEAFQLGPKNNELMRDPNPGGSDFIPDFIDGNPTSLGWGKQYQFREVKDWADMSDTGNLSAMLDYVSNNTGSRLTIYYRSNTYMSGPLTSRIEALMKAGKVDLVPFAGE